MTTGSISIRTLNRSALKKGFEKAKEVIALRTQAALASKGVPIIDYEYENKEWSGFTGNAQLSYAFYLFDSTKANQAPLLKYRTVDNHRPAIRAKVAKGEDVRLKDPYEGEERWVRGQADLSTDTAEDAVNKVMDMPKRRFGATFGRARFTLAVEYEEFLQSSDGTSPFARLHATAALMLKGLNRTV